MYVSNSRAEPSARAIQHVTKCRSESRCDDQEELTMYPLNTASGLVLSYP
jgi:hypothetical protein